MEWIYYEQKEILFNYVDKGKRKEEERRNGQQQIFESDSWMKWNSSLFKNVNGIYYIEQGSNYLKKYFYSQQQDFFLTLMREICVLKKFIKESEI